MAIKNGTCKAAEAKTTSLITMVFIPGVGRRRRTGRGRGEGSEPFKSTRWVCWFERLHERVNTRVTQS